MYVMITDETNQQPSKEARFFIYGGLIIPIEKFAQLNDEIAGLRLRMGYNPTDQFKFDTRSRPRHIGKEAVTQGKSDVVDLCSSLGCTFIATVILHDIAKNQDNNQRMQMAADYVIGRYNQFLASKKADGICVVDNVPSRSELSYLSEKFVCGLALPGDKKQSLTKIKLFASTCLQASHTCSAVDIVLGAFRYCVNGVATNKVAPKMLYQVSRLMWKKPNNSVLDAGLILRPRLDGIRVLKYKQETRALIDKFIRFYDQGEREYQLSVVNA